jgi:predicted PurR-regulated permease PerM
MTQIDKPTTDKSGAPLAKPKKSEHERESQLRLEPGADTDGDNVLAFDGWTRASQVATVGLFVIALLWCAYAAQPVIVPVLLAWAIATIVLPMVSWLSQQGVPRILAVIVVTVLLVVLFACLLVLLSTPVAYWLGRASEVGVLVKQKLQTMTQPLALLSELQKALNAIGAGGSGGQPAVRVEQQSASVVTTIFSVLTPAVSEFILFIGALVFYLVYQKKLRSTAVYFLAGRDARLTVLRTLSDIDDNMTTYFGTFTIVNLCLGFVTVVLTWLVGLPNPLLWGVLAAVLNYIPYIGPAIVVGTLGVVGLLTYPTMSEALIAPLAYLVLTTVEGHFLTPALMGRRLELNPFAVFLAIAFCTWLWGPVGAFLAVPLLMASTVALGHAFSEEKPDLPN